MLTMMVPEGDAYFARKLKHGSRFQYDLYTAALQYVTDRLCAVDVGAHVGSWTRAMAEDFLQVRAWEPNGSNFACLAHNTADCPNVIRTQAALGATEGMCDLEKHGDNSGCWRVKSGQGIPMLTLDSYYIAPNLLKLDVEGYEGAVLQGAIQTLRNHKPVVVFEDNGLGASFYGDAWIDPKPILSRLGYRSRKRINKDEVWTCR